MSEFDLNVAWFLKLLIIPPGVTLLLLWYVWKNSMSLRQKAFARFYPSLLACYCCSLEGSKEELFHELQNLQSLDLDCCNRGYTRILEIGVGQGTNFKYYPKNAHLVAAEPNSNFREHLLHNCEKFPHVVLERMALDEGENLHSVADDSMDVVITTSVLCSVRDVDAVLSEVRRVLVPGGRYFFMEHVVADAGTWSHKVQSVIRSAWYFLLDCNLTRNVRVNITEAGFAEVRLKSFVAPLGMPWRLILGPHIFGTALK